MHSSATDGLVIHLRDMHSGDMPFIMSSWCKSAYEQPIYAWLPFGTFSRLYHDYVGHAIDSGWTQVTLAVNVDDDSQIFGWLARNASVDVPCVDYVYVKQLYRRLGVATRLMRSIVSRETSAPESILVTHRSSIISDSVALHYVPELFFDARAIKWMRERHYQHKHGAVQR